MAYMTEAIKNISENVANGIGKDGATYMAKSYVEIVYPPKETSETAEDVINRIKQKLKDYK